jgi:parallel beta-helix repeat protein
MKRFLLITAFVLSWTQVHADTLYVSVGKYSSIQSAIDDANDGDVIIADPNTYYENINFLGKAITVRSTDPNDPNVVAATTIDGNQPDDPNKASVVTFNNGEDANSVLSGFTITGGTGSWLLVSWEFKGLRWNRCGGGVVCYNMSAPTISKNVFTGNTAGQGGGIYIYGDSVNPDDPSNPAFHISPVITDNTFTNNSAIIEHGFDPPDNNYPANDHGDGGAIVAFQGCDPIVTDNLMQNNHADYYGGAVHFRQWSDGEICKNQILSNNSLLGAGIHITYTSAPLIADNLIKSNVCIGGGGGIYVFYYSDALIERNFITQNESSCGAGIAVYTSSEPQIRNNLVVENNGVGILCWSNGVTIITGNTISDNYPYFSSGGGGIYYWVGESLLIENNIITSNDDFGIFGEVGAATVRYNDVWGSELGNYGGVLSDQTGINGNISIDPNFVGPGYWDDANTPANPNDDFFVTGNYHLLAMSGCIDAGDPNYPEDSNEYDIDGDTRIIGGRIDIGADEYTFGELSDFSGNGIVNFEDFAVLAYYWQDYVCEEPDWCEGCDYDESGIVDHDDLRRFAENWLWKASWYE